VTAYIETPRQPITKATKKQIVKKGKIDMKKEQFKKAKTAHRAEIVKVKEQRKKLKQDIKKHKLLIKQARIMYKLGKMKGGK